jgi:hypothetical protein
MTDKDYGLIIEGFAQGCFSRMFDNEIDVRHHPLTSWSQSTVSGSQSNFQETRNNVLNTFHGVQHTLHNAGGNTELLDELGEVEVRLKQSTNVTELGNVISEARPVLDRAFNR